MRLPRPPRRRKAFPTADPPLARWCGMASGETIGWPARVAAGATGSRAMDNNDSQASDAAQRAVRRSDIATGPLACNMDPDVALGYEAAVPWLQQSLWDEALQGRMSAASDR